MSAGAWPTGQDSWHAYAADLNSRMELLQLHVEPRWLFALCTSCGWDLELDRSELPRFRFEAATHRCDSAPDIEPVLSVRSVSAHDEVLF